MQAKSADDTKRSQRGKPSPRPRRQRTSVRKFLREVNHELRSVHWPSRREVVSYSTVVLVAVTLLTLYVALLDQGFGQLVLWMFQ